MSEVFAGRTRPERCPECHGTVWEGPCCATCDYDITDPDDAAVMLSSPAERRPAGGRPEPENSDRYLPDVPIVSRESWLAAMRGVAMKAGMGSTDEQRQRLAERWLNSALALLPTGDAAGARARERLQVASAALHIVIGELSDLEGEEDLTKRDVHRSVGRAAERLWQVAEGIEAVIAALSP